MVTAKSISPPIEFEADERQLEAIEHVQGPILVVAGAGTGKTSVLTRRIARLIGKGHARPDEILALTYTVNAAKEMRQRVQNELGGRSVPALRTCTFHDYCNGLLQRNGRGFGVLDDKDLWIYLRRRIRELHLNYFVRAADLGKFLSDLLEFMRRCQDELVTPDKYAEYVGRLERGELPLPRVSKSKDAESLSEEESLGRCREIATVFSTVERMLAEESLGSFGHMISRAYELLGHDGAQLAAEQQGARFILVDEFQDANFAQVRILHLLAGAERNIFAVGDPDQGIYRFRGASSAAFELFRRHFPGAKLVVLGKNRRSTTPILQCAFKLINKNPPVFRNRDEWSYQRAPLISAREERPPGEGVASPSAPVEAVVSVGRGVECADVAAAIRRCKRETHCPWGQIAVLYRQHSHRDEVARELAEQGIPFSIENLDVLDMAEVRDLLACLGAVVSVNDGASLFRVAALPQFEIDGNELRAAMGAAPKSSGNPSLASVLEKIKGGTAVLESLQTLREKIASPEMKISRALGLILPGFKLDPASPPIAAVLQFAREWEKKAITRSGEPAEFLEYLEYFREAGGLIALPNRNEDAVNLMTVHTAKGLEWNHVLILRANPTSFPLPYREPLVEFPNELRDPDSAAEVESKELHGQEERRLFYVAMTRARDSLAIYAREGKGKNATPPGFLRELLEDRGCATWLRKRQAQAAAGDLFAGAEATPVITSRTGEWLKMAPVADLSQKLSATAVDIYERCPLQFKFEREWKIPRDVPAAMQYGAVMHLVLRAYYEAVRVGRDLGDETVMEVFRRELADASIQDHYQYELYEKQGASQLKDFVASSRLRPAPDVLHTEERFEVCIGARNIVGRIDRVDRAGEGGVIITDYKTGKPRSQKDADQSLQLSIYALAAQEKWDYSVESLVFYNLEENGAVTTARSDLQLEEARLRVEAVAAGIAAGKFDPKPDFHCAFCPYHNLCPATEKVLHRAAQKSAAPSRRQ